MNPRTEEMSYCLKTCLDLVLPMFLGTLNGDAFCGSFGGLFVTFFFFSFLITCGIVSSDLGLDLVCTNSNDCRGITESRGGEFD